MSVDTPDEYSDSLTTLCYLKVQLLSYQGSNRTVCTQWEHHSNNMAFCSKLEAICELCYRNMCVHVATLELNMYDL